MITRVINNNLLNIGCSFCRGLHEDEAMFLRECFALLFLHVTSSFQVAATTIIIIRPPEGRAYVLPVMYLLSFFIFSPRVLRAPSTNRPETLPHGRNVAVLYNPTPKFGGRSPKNLGAKNMQNFRQFWTTSDFDRKYLRNGSRYPKLES